MSLPEEFTTIIAQVQDEAVAVVDKQLAERRAFAVSQRTGDNTSLNDMLKSMIEDDQAKLDEIDTHHNKMKADAAAAAKAKEPADVPTDGRFPAPIFTE